MLLVVVLLQAGRGKDDDALLLLLLDDENVWRRPRSKQPVCLCGRGGKIECVSRWMGGIVFVLVVGGVLVLMLLARPF
jgi:hypothetical protein